MSRQKIVPPAHIRADIAEFAMASWFVVKNCPGRENLLSVVPELYKQLISTETDAFGDARSKGEIQDAEFSALESVAKMIAVCIDREQSLVEWILEKNKQTFTADVARWYAICCAAGWVVIQTYFRELKSENGGE